MPEHLKQRVTPESVTDLTVLNTHNARVFIVFFLLSFLFIDALKFNLHEGKQIQQKHYKYNLYNIFYNSLF